MQVSKTRLALAANGVIFCRGKMRAVKMSRVTQKDAVDREKHNIADETQRLLQADREGCAAGEAEQNIAAAAKPSSRPEENRAGTAGKQSPGGAGISEYSSRGSRVNPADGAGKKDRKKKNADVIDTATLLKKKQDRK